MTFDGKRQRNALTAAERAIEALGAGDGARATKSAARAADLDQVGLYADLPSSIDTAAAELTASGTVSPASWDAIAAAVGDGPLRFLVDEVRDG